MSILGRKLSCLDLALHLHKSLIIPHPAAFSTAYSESIIRSVRAHPCAPWKCRKIEALWAVFGERVETSLKEGPQERAVNISWGWKPPSSVSLARSSLLAGQYTNGFTH